MDEIKAKIDQHMMRKEYDLALALIESELLQPYLPSGFTETYLEYKQ
jgi:hypothetical protein